MLRGFRAISSLGNIVKSAILKKSARFKSYAAPARMEEHGFEGTTISNILGGKGQKCRWLLALVHDERLCLRCDSIDYLIKIIVQGRSSKLTKVGDIMTEENKLITVTPETKVLKAMELMTDNRIRHIPVINDKEMMGMVFVGDVVRTVVSKRRPEWRRDEESFRKRRA
ncbi:hypothetical protein AHAS_Ahas01G0023000 [Arachis hypogaea]